MNALILSLALPLAGGFVPDGDAAPGAGEPGGPGLAIRCAKVLVCPADPSAPQVLDRALVLIRDGLIEAVGPARGAEVPDGYEELDVGDSWLSPGMIGLHSHVAGSMDINDMVYLTNPGLSARASIRPANRMLKMAVAGGVTTVLYIPGSGTNIGGGGVLLKTGLEHYEEALTRDPGSLKLAQWGNPESWAMGVSMSFENWNTRNTLRRGKAYGERWRAYEEGRGPRPKIDPQWEIFRPLVKGETIISTHTQVYQVVLMTLTMVKGELNLPVFLDHSTIGGWRAGGLAEKMGVSAIVGPRNIDPPSRGFINWSQASAEHEGFRGVAAGYQEEGNTMVGFNTDAPVLPQEELPLQGAIGARFGFDDSGLQVVRGLTIVPAMTVGIDDRLGSIEVGKEADILVVNGHPADPRTAVEIVFIEGKRVYEAEEGRPW